MQKKNTDTLVWIDLEMSGLDVNKDGILEIATIITDNQLVVKAQGPSLVIAQPAALLAGMDEWCTNQHGKSGLTAQVLQSTISLAQAEQQTIDFVMQYCKEGEGVLCGNSVWQDRLFIMRYMPRLGKYLHYRMIDVSSVKELVRNWYPNNPHTAFKKSDTHRTLQDIQESIAELRHYRTYFFIQEPLR